MNRFSRSLRCLVPLPLTWTSGGATYRVAAWPDATFERRYGSEWVAVAPAAELLIGARLHPAAWRAYLEFVPTDVRDLLGRFGTNRVLALHVAARCPDIVGALTELPALLTFVGCHAELRGSPIERWDELAAQFERGGVFGVFDWLGMPATKQTVTILGELISADLAPRLAAPVRAALWRPTGLLAIAAHGPLAERALADGCALAA